MSLNKKDAATPTMSRSETPTVVMSETNSVAASEPRDFVDQVQHELFPGADEKKKHPYLVEFDPDDPDNPKVC